MTYNVFGGTLSLTQSITLTARLAMRTLFLANMKVKVPKNRT